VHLITEASGLLASLSGFLLWLPQARRVWQDRHDRERLAGVSLQTQVLALLGNTLWGIYALGIGSFWLGAPSVVNIPVTIMTITIVLRAQRATAAAITESSSPVELPATFLVEIPTTPIAFLAEVPQQAAPVAADGRTFLAELEDLAADRALLPEPLAV
jgi:uncharacterized protein with PQ loop repeat